MSFYAKPARPQPAHLQFLGTRDKRGVEGCAPGPAGPYDEYDRCWQQCCIDVIECESITCMADGTSSQALPPRGILVRSSEFIQDLGHEFNSVQP